jgi:hypothetical protein
LGIERQIGAVFPDEIQQRLFVVFGDGGGYERLESGSDRAVRRAEALLVPQGDLKVLVSLRNPAELIVADGETDVEGSVGEFVACLVALLEELAELRDGELPALRPPWRPRPI